MQKQNTPAREHGEKHGLVAGADARLFSLGALQRENEVLPWPCAFPHQRAVFREVRRMRLRMLCDVRRAICNHGHPALLALQGDHVVHGMQKSPCGKRNLLRLVSARDKEKAF